MYIIIIIMSSLTITMGVLRGYVIHRSALFFVAGKLIVARDRSPELHCVDKWARLPPLSKVASSFVLNMQVPSKGTEDNDLRLWTR